MAFRPQWTVIPSSTLTTPPTNIVDIPPLLTSFATGKTHAVNVKYPRALLKAQDSNVDLDNGSSGDAQASSNNPAATTNWFASNPYTSFTNCDSGSLFCPVGTCYSGVNGYIGCCTISSCAARTTCIPYHHGQKSCDEDTEGCVFCSNPATPYCYHFENWDAIPTAFAMWCTNSPSATIVFYSNPVTYQYIADLPSATFTPSWPTTSTSSTSTPFFTFPTSSATNAAITVTSGASAAPDSDPSSNDVSSYSGVNLSTSGIIGIAVGGAVVLALIVALIAFFLWKKGKSKATRQHSIQQHGETLGGAVLPGTWFGGNGHANQNGVRENSAGVDGIRLVQQPEMSDETTANQELEDTTVPAYSIELGGTSTGIPSTTPFSDHHQAMSVRPSFAPYSPMSIILPGSPYANHQASYSDPGLGNHQGNQGSSEVYRDLDGHSWIQHDHNQHSTRAPTHIARTSYNAENVEGYQLPVVSQALSQHSSSTRTPSGIISPMSTSTSPRLPLFQRISTLQPDSIAETLTSEQQGVAVPLLSEEGYQNVPSNNSPSSNQNQFMINQSTSLSSHPSNIEFMSPPQQMSETAAPAATSTSVKSPEKLTLSDSHLGANTRLSPDQPNSDQLQAVSARGSWSTWVSPEAAYAEGLWEGQSGASERQGREVDTEQSKKEKKD